MKTYKHLSFKERIQIETWRKALKSIHWIAKELDRAPSTISRELKRNKVRRSYDWGKANIKAYQRTHSKQKAMKKIRMCTELEYLIRRLLREWRWPELTALRLMEEYKYYISWSTIRRYLDSRFAYDIKQHMLENKLLQKYRKKRREKWSKIQHRVSIDIRPLYISNPWTTSHYEVDFIESIKWDKTVILRLIDKYSRFRIAIKLPHKWSKLVKHHLAQCIKKYGIKSMTFDNDMSFGLHRELWIQTYFCNPYSSREKWLVERSNRQYRKPRPKKTKLKNISQDDLDAYTNYLNHRPMKCLNWKSPYEVNFNTILSYLPTNFKVLH
jgi:transposase, IS30 family